MDIKWLEDFITLAEVKSFSKAAALRHSSQPAFSRRIQALEAWTGSHLIDRTNYPTQLTAAGLLFYEQALGILSKAHRARNMLRHGESNFIQFAVPHSLSLNFFPKWLYLIQAHLGSMNSRLKAINVHDGVLMLLEGGCDLLMSYHHAQHPIGLNQNQYAYACLDKEYFAPYSKADWRGAPLHHISNQPYTFNTKKNKLNLPFLAYSSSAYLGRITEYLTHDLAKYSIYLDKCYETDMAEALKYMAIEGHGIAFLPKRSIEQELAQGILVRADDVEHGLDLSINLDIRLYKCVATSPDIIEAEKVTYQNYSMQNDILSQQKMLENLWNYVKHMHPSDIT
jgi:LysR family transcriptional regulator, hypochlorite-specific transcription factor HypT